MKERSSFMSHHSSESSSGPKAPKSAKNNNRTGKGIGAFIDSLISPPSLSNSLKRSNSDSIINDSVVIHR